MEFKKSNENCDSHSFRQNNLLLSKHIYLVFAVLDLSKFLKFETYYDKLQPYFGQENIHLEYMYTDSFRLSITTSDSSKNLKNLEEFDDFTILNKNNEIFSIENKEVIGNFGIETPKIIWIDEFACLRSKMYAFRCGSDSKNELKGISNFQSKLIKIEEYKKCW